MANIDTVAPVELIELDDAPSATLGHVTTNRSPLGALALCMAIVALALGLLPQPVSPMTADTTPPAIDSGDATTCPTGTFVVGWNPTNHTLRCAAPLPASTPGTSPTHTCNPITGSLVDPTPCISSHITS